MVRRILPEDVFGTLPGRANTIVSAGTPIAATIAAPTAACSGEPSGGSAPRVSATTTSRSVPVARILDAEGGDAAAPHARHFGDRFLDLLRVDVAAAGDDDVLGAAGDEEIAVVVDEAEIAGVDPAVLAQHGRRRVGVLEVALHRRRAAELDAALDADGRRSPRVVDDAQLVPRDRPAAGDERQRLRIVGRGAARSPARAGTPRG